SARPSGDDGALRGRRASEGASGAPLAPAPIAVRAQRAARRASLVTHTIPANVAGFISRRHVGHLRTSAATGQSLVVPFCYASDGTAIFAAIDAKPKRAEARDLRRVRNITENAKVCVVIDEYDEDWRKLRHVIIQGQAEILTEGPDYQRGIDLL